MGADFKPCEGKSVCKDAPQMNRAVEGLCSECQHLQKEAKAEKSKLKKRGKKRNVTEEKATEGPVGEKATEEEYIGEWEDCDKG